MTKNEFIIGTRGSLLAVTQCTLIKEEMEQKTGKRFTLKHIKTQGDQVTNKALWQLEGKDFFTKELDAALLSNEVDLVVHSYKDLGSERPEGIKLGAITTRQFPHDILLMPKNLVAKIKVGDFKQQQMVIGTSSPRRIVNIPQALNELMPSSLGVNDITTKVLRGNVNSRIEKLLAGEFDAIILAMAGLERLAHRDDSKKVLEELVKDLSFLVLPTKLFPPAASQGALAIEFHQNSPHASEIAAVLNSVHNKEDAELIAKERAIFQSYGGGCHLSMGIFVDRVNGHTLINERGRADENTPLIHKNVIENEEKWEGPLTGLMGKKDPLHLYEEINCTVDLKKFNTLFISSSRVIPFLEKNRELIKDKLLIAAGPRTARKLFAENFVVNYVVDFSSVDEIAKLKKSQLLQTFMGNKLEILSLTEESIATTSTYDDFSQVGVYRRVVKDLDPREVEAVKEQLHAITNWYFGSYSQFKSYQKFCRKNDIQMNNIFCGLGKTYQAFKEAGVMATPIVNLKEHLKEK